MTTESSSFCKKKLYISYLISTTDKIGRLENQETGTGIGTVIGRGTYIETGTTFILI